MACFFHLIPTSFSLSPSCSAFYCLDELILSISFYISLHRSLNLLLLNLFRLSPSLSVSLSILWPLCFSSSIYPSMSHSLFVSISLPLSICLFQFLSGPNPSPDADILNCHVHFQDHDLILGSLPHFFAIFLEEFLAHIDLVCLPFLYQTELAKLLPATKIVSCVYLPSGARSSFT